jgi:hypothetical protein
MEKESDFGKTILAIQFLSLYIINNKLGASISDTWDGGGGEAVFSEEVFSIILAYDVV